MMLPPWHEEAINKSHDRKSFDCGNSELNEFLQKHARQSHDGGGAKTFCAIDDTHPAKVLGFYSVVPSAVTYDLLPSAVTKGLPRHKVGGVLLARIATLKELQGQGLGGQLLLAAGRRCLRVAAEAGGALMLIDAKNEKAAAWYESYGATQLIDTPLTLVLPFKTIEAVLAEVGKL